MKYFLLILLLLAPATKSLAQYTGSVYIDDNANGIRDPGEGPAGGVAVTDGREVVRSAPDGRFALSGFEGSRFVRITIPSGYRLGTRFFEPIRAETTDYVFGIVPDGKSPKDRTIRMLQLSDTETPLYGDWAADMRDYAKNQEVDFIVHNGDICYEPGMRMHAAQITTQTMGVPVFYVLGNHDLIRGRAYGEELFEELFGPTHYSFEAGDTHFVVTPMPVGDARPSYTQQDMITWLKNDLRLMDNKKHVVFIHHESAKGRPRYTLRSGQDSIDLLDYNLKAWFNGHWHTNYLFRDTASGVYNVTTAPPSMGGSDNSPARFVVAEFDGSGVKSIQTRHAFVQNHVALVSPDRDGRALIEDGTLQLSLQAYDSKREVGQVVGYLYDPQKRLIDSVELEQVSDWNWSSRLALSGKTQRLGKRDLLQIEVEVRFYGGGTVLVKNPVSLQEPQTGKMSGPTSSRISWLTNIGGPVWKSSPLLVDGQLFVATAHDTHPKPNSIRSLDKKTGQVRWTVQTRNAIKSKLQYAQGTLLATDVDGQVYALDAGTGKVLWTRALQPDKSVRGYITGSVVSDNIYYTGIGNYLQALDIRSGQTIWTNEDWGEHEGTGSSMLIAGETLLTGCNWVALYGQDLRSGKVRWKLHEDGLRFRSSTGTVHGDTLYIASTRTIFAIDPASGIVHRKAVKPHNFNVMAAPLVWNDLILLATADRGVAAFDLHSFEEIWQFETGSGLVYSSPYTGKGSKTVENTLAIRDGQVIFGASDGYLYVLDGKTGNPVARHVLGAPVFSDVVIDPEDGAFFVGDYAGNIYRFD